MQKINLKITWLMAIVILISFGCEDDLEYKVPEAKTILQNDVIKRTYIGPYIVGLDIQFAYAMALGPNEGKLISAHVDASIPGAEGTYLENKSFYTDNGGNDVGIEVGNPSVTSGGRTEVVFTRDTCAATLRYYYVIPEEARGKSVSFTFNASASTGETVSFNMGPYNIAKTEMKRDIVLSDDNLLFFSVADMQAYSATEAATIADKIDLVYLYRPISGISFNHSLVAPAANSEFLPDITLPSGVNSNTKIQKTWGLRDQHLARDRWGEFVDDIDFESIDLSEASNYALNLRNENGIWGETEDGKYRAFIYVNAVNNSAKTMTVSIKRYTL
jgi:hypothetical protein